MKRGVWIPVLCVVVASAAFRLLKADQPAGDGKSPVSRYSERNSSDGESDAREAAVEPRAFRLRPVKPVSEIGATAVPELSAPKVPAAKSTPNSSRFAKKTGIESLAESKTPADDGKGVKPAVFELPARAKKTGGVRHAADERVHVSPFPPKKTKQAPPTPGSDPFAEKPPVPKTAAKKKSAKPKVQQAKFEKPSVKNLPLLDRVPNAPRTPMVTVEWIKQSDINVGQKCRCDLVVRNSGKLTARYVSVEVAVPSTVRLVSAKPMPKAAKDRAVWKIDTLAPGKTKTIELTMIPAASGDISLNTAVRLTGMTPGVFTVNEPKLKIAFIGPEKVLIGNPAPQVIEISNPGTGIAKSVAIEATIPGGLQHPAGDRLAMEIGALNPGEVRKVRLTLKAITAGKQIIKIKAKSEATLSKTATQTVAVSAPSLKVAIDGPGLRYIGRNAVYKITVKNNGSIATNNVRVLHRLPEGMRFLKADKGGSYSYPRRTIGWFVGRLEPGNSVSVQAIAACQEIGKTVHLAGAVSEQGTKAQATCTTNIDGISSLAVEIFNPDDPVEVGVATTYEVRVKNKGTKADSGIVIACEIPAGMELLNAKGVTRSAAGKGKVVFAPLKSLEPGKTAIYRIQVRGKTAGNNRFRINLRSGSIKEALSFEKLTRFYSD